MNNINISSSLLPEKKGFVKSSNFDERNKIFTFAIGSNNNVKDWNKFVENNLNRGLITNTKTIDNNNINSLKKCLKFVDEGEIKDYYLTFSSYSYKRGGCGVASLSYSKNTCVKGCIFELICDGFITKKNIINLIRWKEDFPYFYKEIILSVTAQSGIKYNCLVYIINSKTNITNLNKIFPTIPLPPSNYYIKLVLESHNNFNFDQKWLTVVKKILEKARYYRNRFNNLINDMYKKFNNDSNKKLERDFTLIRYIKSNYNNTNFRSFRLAKNNNEELFKIYVLLGAQCILFASKNAIKNPYILKLLKNISVVEYRCLIRIVNLLLVWDSKIKMLQM